MRAWIKPAPNVLAVFFRNFGCRGVRGWRSAPEQIRQSELNSLALGLDRAPLFLAVVGGALLGLAKGVGIAPTFFDLDFVLGGIVTPKHLEHLLFAHDLSLLPSVQRRIHATQQRF